MSTNTISNAPQLELIICTLNRADSLCRTLEAIAAQESSERHSWSVLVVDNNSTDHTGSVVESFKEHIPGLKRSIETRQGLTEARQLGIRNTTAPWVAFVDDDCVLDKLWVSNALAFCHSHPDAAGFNGENILHLEGDRSHPWVHPNMFACDNPVSGRVIKQTLHGAGMGLRRDALIRSGWLDEPLASDRTSGSLVSGGDNEIALRTRAFGGELYHVKDCVLHHYIDEERLTLWYLMRLNFRLEECASGLSLMKSNRSLLHWHWHSFKTLVRIWLQVASLVKDRLRATGGGWRSWLLGLARACGFLVGYLKLGINFRIQKKIRRKASRKSVQQVASGT